MIFPAAVHTRIHSKYAEPLPALLVSNPRTWRLSGRSPRSSETGARTSALAASASPVRAFQANARGAASRTGRVLPQHTHTHTYTPSHTNRHKHNKHTQKTQRHIHIHAKTNQTGCRFNLFVSITWNANKRRSCLPSLVQTKKKKKKKRTRAPRQVFD